MKANIGTGQDLAASSCNEQPIKYKKWANPYNRRETWSFLFRHIFGINTRRNRGLARYIPHKTTLNGIIDSKVKIGIIGDIMDMAGRVWIPGDDLKRFFSPCNYLLGNFEATIVTSAQKEPKGVIFSVSQRHDENIVNSLESLFDPEKIYLSVSNNHAGDFGQSAFEKSVHILEQNRFHVFGLAGTPFIDVDKHVRIITGTRWSNQACELISTLNSPEESSDDFTDQGRFNILYPHWSYELELYPRPETIEQGKTYLGKFDAIVGHHSHTPQPLAQANRGLIKTIIAYSLGDICTRLKCKKYRYGIALKFDVGSNRAGQLVIGNLEWSFTECNPTSKTEYQTNLVENLPYLPNGYIS